MMVYIQKENGRGLCRHMGTQRLLSVDSRSMSRMDAKPDTAPPKPHPFPERAPELELELQECLSGPELQQR